MKNNLSFEELEKQYLAICESETDAIITSDESQCVKSWNRGAINIFGYNEEEIIGKPISVLIPESSRINHNKGINKIIEGGKPKISQQTIELNALNKNGVEFPIELTLGFWSSEGKKYYSAIIRDITKRKEIESAINEQNKRFQTISQSDNDAIITSDESKKILSWNRGAEKIFGYKEDEVLNQPIAKIVPARHHVAHDAGMERINNGEPPRVLGNAVELSAIKKNGEEFPVELTLGMWKNNNKIYYSGIIRDITERKETERIIKEQNHQITIERDKSDGLLKNILPEQIISELKATGATEPVKYKEVSILFTDIEGFTHISEKLSNQELVQELNTMFSRFDYISRGMGLEKIKTIGDAYMCAGGLPEKNYSHAVDCVMSAIKFQNYVLKKRKEWKELGKDYWKIRIGIHTGPVLAGVVGSWKYTYDIWGDSVNIAARMEQSGIANRVNISQSTYEQVKELFSCIHRGKVIAKNKGVMDMYLVDRIHPDLSIDKKGLQPNDEFYSLYEKLKSK